MTDYVYLDYAAATPCDERVLVAMQPFFAEHFYNPSSMYEPARVVRQAANDARSLVAHWLGCRPEEFVFTAGGSEANNLAVHGVMRSQKGGNCIVSAIEHDAVLESAKRYDSRVASVDTAGRLRVDRLSGLIDDNTALISLMYVNNEIGTIQPINEVAQVVRAVRRDRQKRGVIRPIWLHTDASQAANYLDLHVARLGVDMMTLNGGKIYGPKQSGGLYAHRSVQLDALINGGGQERSLRSGTENVAFMVGFSVALDVAQTVRHDEVHRLSQLQQYFVRGVAERVSNSQFNGSRHHQLVSISHFTFPGHQKRSSITGA
jgi:cysteine desulfurase